MMSKEPDGSLATMPESGTEIVPGPGDKLNMTCLFPGAEPNVLFSYWSSPELLIRWWPEHAEIEPHPGGAYHLSWPSMMWSLKGRYTTFESARVLGFTWKWDHEPDRPKRDVLVTFDSSDRGTRVTVEHGVYGGSPEDLIEKEGHIEGWTHFLSRLQAIFEAGAKLE